MTDTSNDDEIVVVLENENDPTVNDEVPNWDSTEENRHATAVNAVAATEGEGFEFLRRGGRDPNTVEWDFMPMVTPIHVDLDGIGGHPQDESLEGFYTITNIKGEPSQFAIFNPNERSEQQPIGAHLGTVSERYAAVSYAEIYSPLVRECNRNGWDWKITCFDQGKKARMDIDVSKIRKSEAKLGEVYKYGVTIHNSLDGSGSLKIGGVAQRLACLNGMIATKKQNLASFRHTKGSIGKIDFDKLASELSEMILEVENELRFVEGLKDINWTDELFEKMLVAAQTRGIITLPKARPVLHERTGEIVDYEIMRGHYFRLAMQGWSGNGNQLDWVKVDGEDVSTAFHGYQVLTGALTHKPVWNGPQTLNGNGESAPLRGAALNLKTLDDRLYSVHALIRDIAQDKINIEKLPTPLAAMGIATVA